MINYGPNQFFDLNTPFERSLSKLSENHKNFEIGSMIPKLWLFNYPPAPIHYTIKHLWVLNLVSSLWALITCTHLAVQIKVGVIGEVDNGCLVTIRAQLSSVLYHHLIGVSQRVDYSGLHSTRVTLVITGAQ